MNVFKKPYTIRRYGKKTWENGLPRSNYKDYTVYLDIQPQGDGTTRNGDGHWVTRNVKAYSDVPLVVADPDNGIDGDRVLINGRWYECVGCEYWGNTILTHYECSLTAVEEEA